MMLKDLLTASKQYLEQHPGYVTEYSFAAGAVWMQQHLLTMGDKAAQPLKEPNRFTKYGVLKYSISLVAFIISVVFFYQYCVYLLPLSVVVFYLVEVQFLFLFPLLIDDVSEPVLNSIRATYRIGVFRAIFITMCIGIFMLAGLLRLKDPLHNWHVGCLAVLIWYRDEVRDWL